MAETTKSGTTRRSVLVSLVVNCAETLGLGVAAGVTGSVALRAQTAANAADVAVQVFLLIGVLSSVRPPDQTHPLGYGRERFFWSLLAALGIFLGGGVLGLDAAVRAALHPSAIHSYPVAYLVLVTTVVLDAFALEIGLRPVREQAACGCLVAGLPGPKHRSRIDHGRGRRRLLGDRRHHGHGRARPERGDRKPGAGHGGERAYRPAASASLRAFAANEPGSAVRAWRSGAHAPRNVPGHRRTGGGGRCPGPVRHRDRAIELVVDGDVTFAHDLDVPAVEQTILRCIHVLRERWPKIKYVYLTPVGKARPTRAARSGALGVDGKQPRPPWPPGSRSSTDG